MAKKPKPPEWVTFEDALRAFVLAEGGTEGSTHIDPMHWHVASRLVVEGGFDPDFIKPRPPFVIKRKAGRLLLAYDASAARPGEATVLGGLKTKDIDVVVSIPGVGPCVAISMKGSLNAFRNLTNRLEEAIGDCANVHMGYPSLVYGFLILMCANREGLVPSALKGRLQADGTTGRVKMSDIAIRSNGDVSEYIGGFHEAMVRLAGRKDLRDDVSRYEAVSLLLASPDDATLGKSFVNIRQSKALYTSISSLRISTRPTICAMSTTQSGSEVRRVDSFGIENRRPSGIRAQRG